MRSKLLVVLGVLGLGLFTLLSTSVQADTTNATLTRVSGGALVTWSGTLDVNGDVGNSQAVLDRTPKSVQIDGAFGTGGTMLVEGSVDGTTWSTLVNNAGTAISCTAACFHGIRDHPRFIRPRISAGTGAINLNVRLFLGD